MLTKSRNRFARIVDEMRANGQIEDAFMFALLVMAMFALMHGMSDAIDGVFRVAAAGGA